MPLIDWCAYAKPNAEYGHILYEISMGVVGVKSSLLRAIWNRYRFENIVGVNPFENAFINSNHEDNW